MDSSKQSHEYQLGLKIIREQLGPQAEGYIEKIRAISPPFADVNVSFPFGSLYSRKVLDSKTRELITIGALTVMGYALPELEVHIKGALHCGVTREEILEVILQMLAYIGFPAATNALLTAQKVFDQLDGRGA
jgi:4-carboxymuconolactone decarboxylase